MKKSLLFICLMAISLCSWAQGNGHDNTTDHVSISELQLTPGEDVFNKYFVVSLVGSQTYMAATMDVELPDGYEFAYYNGSILVNNNFEKKQGLYPVTNQTYVDMLGVDPEYNSHSFSLNQIDNKTVRVIIMSMNSINFATNSGNLFRVFIKATPYAKPGYADIKIKNCFFNTEDATQWDTKDITISDKVSASNTSTVPVSVSAEAKWGTCILPFSCALPSGVKAYTCNSKDENNLLLTEVPQLAAYTPYILYSEAGYSGNLSGNVDAGQYPAEGFVKSGYLSGAIVPQTINSGYVLQNLSGGVMFYSCDGDNFNIPAGKCWVNIDGGSARERLGFKIENSLTGISNVAESSDANAIYTLSGLRVKDAAAPGIYVVNKKKVLKK